MANRKRDKNIIILGFMFSIGIFVAFVFLGYFYVYSEVAQIQDKKAEFNQVLTGYNDLKVKGLSYSDFSELSKKKTFENQELKKEILSSHTSDLLGKIEEDFYDLSFINTTGGDYMKYLDDKIVEIENSEKKKDFIKKEGKALLILPVYIDETGIEEKEGLTNFKFINEVENLLRIFNLRTTSPIGISDIKEIDSDSKDNKNKKELEESGVYYIPLKLELTGTKAQIIKFFDYVHSMGSVKEVDGELIIGNSNQITDVSFLKMQDYLDESTSGSSDEKKLRDLMLYGDQANDKVTVSTQINFYVVGVPIYKLKEEIEKIIGNLSEETYSYPVLRARVSDLLKKASTQKETLDKKEIDKINTYLGGINKEITTIKTKVAKLEGLEDIFTQVLKYKEIFVLIEKELNDISNRLNLK